MKGLNQQDSDLIDLIDESEGKFKQELNKLLLAAGKMGAHAIDIRADYLYSRVEGFECDSLKMVLCAKVLKERMQPDDKTLDERWDGDGRFLHIRFQLPRKSQQDDEQEE